MRVAYKAHHRYLCSALAEDFRASQCLSLEGARIDAAVVEAFFAALAPAELDLLDEVLAAQQTERDRLARQYADQVKRAEYEARLAQRQYQAVDPDNRLVAGELERRWELTLRALAEARETAERFSQTPPAAGLDPVLRQQLRDLGQELPALWASGRLTAAHQKTLLRSLIHRVILSRPAPETIEIKVVWVSGAFSVLHVPATVHCGSSLHDYDQFVARLLELSTQGYQDTVIAQRLTEEGFRSARRLVVSPKTVEKIRRTHRQQTLTGRFQAEDQIEGYWTVGGLARHLGVSSEWVRNRIARGRVPAQHHPVTRRYLIADDPAILELLKRELACTPARRAF
jgi:hypothetical protein